jgi:UDP-N-acetylmuramyl tripeptide synthase
MLDRGDYTGPAGARTILRRSDVQAAVLETARGGILRRGLAIDVVDGALITNVSDDHLGGYGIDDVDTMVRVKAVVASAVKPGGRVVLNADDPRLVALASTVPAPVAFFSLDPANKVVAAHRARGGEAWFVKDGAIVVARAESEQSVAAVDQIPICFGGAARYNVANALGAAALAPALGIAEQAIADGLRSFGSSAADNPGRANRFDVGGVALLLDFAHNPAGIRSVLELVAGLRATPGRLALVVGYAGDRGDESIREAAQAVAEARPDRVYVRELTGYERGRAAGEVPALLAREIAQRAPGARVAVAASEVDALGKAMATAEEGDLVVLLAHIERDAVAAWLAARGAVAR